MAIEHFTDSGPMLQEQDIGKAEKLLGAELPQDYKQFLRTTNGGRPHPRYFARLSIEAFYGLYPSGDSWNLLDVYQIMRKHLPKHVIPIACSPYGDEFCLVIEGKFRGKIFYYDHEGPTAEDVDEESELGAKIREELGLEKAPPYDWPEYPSMSLLADSFTEFVDGFYHISDEELFAQIAQSKRKDAGSDDDDE